MLTADSQPGATGSPPAPATPAVVPALVVLMHAGVHGQRGQRDRQDLGARTLARLGQQGGDHGGVDAMTGRVGGLVLIVQHGGGGDVGAQRDRIMNQRGDIFQPAAQVRRRGATGDGMQQRRQFHTGGVQLAQRRRRLLRFRPVLAVVFERTAFDQASDLIGAGDHVALAHQQSAIFSVHIPRNQHAQFQVGRCHFAYLHCQAKDYRSASIRLFRSQCVKFFVSLL